MFTTTRTPDSQPEAGNTSAVAEYIDSYSPKHPDERWPLLASVVKDCVRRCSPHSLPHARELMIAMRRLAEWSYTEAALPIDPERILDGYNIQRFAFTGLNDYAMAYQQTLLRRTNEIAMTTGWGTKLLAGGPNSAAVQPYSSAEVTRFASAALHEPNQRRALAITAMLGLCRGAGLQANELQAIKVRDVSEDEFGLLVTVRRDGRSVSVLAVWDEFVRDAIRDRDPDEKIFPQPRTQIHKKNEKVIRPTPRRLRATWLVDHLNHRVPMNALLLAAGLTSMDHFIGYTSHMDAVHPSEVRKLMTRRGHDD